MYVSLQVHTAITTTTTQNVVTNTDKAVPLNQWLFFVVSADDTTSTMKVSTWPYATVFIVNLC